MVYNCLEATLCFLYFTQMHFLVIQVKACTGRHIRPPLLRLRIKRPVLGPEAHPPSLWKEKTAESTQRVPRACSSEALPWLRPHEPPSAAGQCPGLAGWHDCNRRVSSSPGPMTGVHCPDFLGTAGPLERTSVMWKAKPAGYLQPLSLGVVFCKDGVCLVGQSHVPQPEAQGTASWKKRTLGIYYGKFQLGTYVAFGLFFQRGLQLHSWVC